MRLNFHKLLEDAGIRLTEKREQVGARTSAHTKVPVTMSVMATPTFAGESGLPVMLIKPCVPAMTTSYLEMADIQ